MSSWDEHVKRVMDQQERLTGHRWMEYQGEGPPANIARLIFGHTLKCGEWTECVDLYECTACGAIASGSGTHPDVWLDGETEMMRPCPG
jgi:hypothetical protein